MNAGIIPCGAVTVVTRSNTSPAERVVFESEEQRSERTDDFLQKNRRKRYKACDELVEVTGFEVRACGADFVPLRDKKQVRILHDSAMQTEKTALTFVNAVNDGRGDRIRTCGLFVPNEALYQAEPHLDVLFFLCCPR